MCRHLCPVGNATGQERNTARARALALSLVQRGAQLTPDMVDNLYECTLCGACTNDCATGWDPVLYVKEARLAASLEGKMPGYVSDMLDNVEKTGNIFGDKLDAQLEAEISLLPKNADTLLFLGESARYKSPTSAINAIRLLKKAGVDFTVLTDEPNSGYSLSFLVGAADETKQVMQQTAKRLNYKTVVVYDPDDAKVFAREYKEWDIPVAAEFVTFTAYVAALIDKGAFRPKNSGAKYTFQDPAALARDLDDMSSARKILSACGTCREMLLHGRDTTLAGNLIMNEYIPEIMKKVALCRWENAAGVGAQTVVTASPAEYELLRANKPEGIALLTIEEVVLSCL